MSGSGVPAARWWQPLAGSRVRCDLCPRRCELAPGQAGFCGMRRNEAGQLVSLGYGRPQGLSADPVEKKPLYHFLPGTRTLSFGTEGCNLACSFCQNWHMSRAAPPADAAPQVAPEEVVELALQADCRSIAFTYNEPILFAEYALDVARAARAADLRCLAVTAGFIEPTPRAELFGELAAANIDLKGASEQFYRRWCKAQLQPVLDTIRSVRRDTECWIELTHLVIPGLNDSEAQLQELVDRVLQSVGPDTPLHLSAFHPAHRLTDRPRTDGATLRRARSMARDAGVQHVYLGNVADDEGGMTRCAACDAVLVRRSGYSVTLEGLHDGRCAACGAAPPGVWR